MDVTNSTTGGTTLGRTGSTPGPDVTVWWSCGECGTDIEMAGWEPAAVVVPCPDCAGPLDELWRWEQAAA